MSNSTKLLKELEFDEHPGIIYQIYDQSAHNEINLANGQINTLKNRCDDMSKVISNHNQSINKNIQSIDDIKSDISTLSERVNGLVPIGTIIEYPATTGAGPSALKGIWLLCNGSKVNYENYSELYNVLSNTGMYRPDLIAGEFNLPDFRGKVPWGYNGTGSKYIDAGLPNIVGHTANYQGNQRTRWGAFNNGNKYAKHSRGTGNGAYDWSGDYDYDSFDASYGQTLTNGTLLGNTDARVVYGKSNTVQPPAFQVDFYIKAK